MGLYCCASLFWIRKKMLVTVYFCVCYQPQYQCVRISSDSTCTRQAVLVVWTCLPAPENDYACFATVLRMITVSGL